MATAFVAAAQLSVRSAGHTLPLDLIQLTALQFCCLLTVNTPYHAFGIHTANIQLLHTFRLHRNPFYRPTRLLGFLFSTPGIRFRLHERLSPTLEVRSLDPDLTLTCELGHFTVAQSFYQHVILATIHYALSAMVK